MVAAEAMKLTLRQLAVRSLRFHWRSHLGAWAGAALGSAVLVGALLVGDSVEGSLRELSRLRLGQVTLALEGQDRFFRADLARSMSEALHAPAVSVIRLPGTTARADGSARANQVQVLGVDEAFWSLGPQPVRVRSLLEDAVLLNEALAQQLNVVPGDTVLLRIPRPSRISPEAPLAPTEDTTLALRLQVADILPDRGFGRFNLQASQVPPLNAFVAQSTLQSRLQLGQRANLLLVGSSPPQGLSATTANAALRAHWQLEDAELTLTPLPEGGGLELRSPRVFLDSPIGQAAREADAEAQGILTYFVNELQSSQGRTPYSMVTAASPSWLPVALGDDEILLSQWLADDLQATSGDTVHLTYYAVGLARQLEERSAQFRVRGVLPMAGKAADPTLMPDFPGLTDAENCRDWDAGFPIQTDRIRDRDERYWDDYRGTPKAFVTLATGQRLWSNRFGNLTAVRFGPDAVAERLGRDLLRQMEPARLGLAFQPVGAQAAAATAQSLDFGPLFIGFSLFLIVAALLLMGLMFQLGIERRGGEIGTLLAVGWQPWRVRRLLLTEGLWLALVGGVFGVAAGFGYARAMIYGLTTVWQDAVGTAGLGFHWTTPSVVIGTGAGLGLAAGVLWSALRRQARRPARELLAEGSEEQSARLDQGIGRWQGPAAVLCLLSALGLALWAILGSQAHPAGAFFGSGALLLLAGWSATSTVLHRLIAPPPRAEAASAPGAGDTRLTVSNLALRNAARRRRRSVTAVVLLSSGCFVVASLGVFRLDATRDAFRRSAGTGGFALLGESSLPVVFDLDQAAGREAFGLDDREMAGVGVVPMRLREGEEASCLNLNRAQRPRLLGVDAARLAERQAFTFAQVLRGRSREQPWLLLRPETSSPTNGLARPLPAIGDQASIQWALGKRLGDVITLEDERGEPFEIQLVASLANSVLQGNLLIDEAAFVQRFPSVPGYRMFLIDAPSNRVADLQARLSRALQDVGLELTPAVRKLAAFNAVQNTYLTTFQMLGGLGLLLGSAGLAAVVLRNVLERRAELGLLLALGMRARQVRRLVLVEHALLLVVGMLIGVGSAALAVLPALLTPGQPPPFGSLAITLVAVLANGFFWVWLAVRVACRGSLLQSLRYE
jgi:ABC-type lipoprotein release transport system permease subunit